MSDPIHGGSFDARLPAYSVQHPPLPVWLARRLLRGGEEVALVRGPRWNPSSERYLTHPLLFLLALALGASWWGMARLVGGAGSPFEAIASLAAGLLVVASIFVLGVASGYFTRLVVTNYRLVILQGYEVCRSWGLDDLPPSLIRYGPWGREGRSRSVDLDALQTMLGGGSEQFAEAKTILAFSKHLDHIK